MGAFIYRHFIFSHFVSSGAYLKHKGFTSINCQLLVDHERMIRDAFCGFAGGAHDGRQFRWSTLGRLVSDDVWPPSSPTIIVFGVRVCPYLVVDAAFGAIRQKIFKPLPGGIMILVPWLSKLNYKQSATRMPAEHVNGMMKKRFRILSICPEIWTIEVMVDVIMACSVLHNMCVKSGDSDVDFGDEEAVAPAVGAASVRDDSAYDGTMMEVVTALARKAGCMDD